MRLPGTRYQEPGWEEVRKLLGQCSLAALRGEGGARPDLRDDYVERMAAQLLAQRHGARARAAGNGYGDTVYELAVALVVELRARPADWDTLCAALADDPPGDALLRKKVNDMFAVLRDRVDADNYQAACGRPCSPNRMYAYRMLDTAYHDIARVFADWRAHRAQVGAILGREILDGAAPIEVRQLRTIADCRPEWVLRWSASLEAFGGGPGPLHTRSKRFASLKTSPDKIAAMLREIGDYEQLSANRDQDWLQDLDDASAWVEDYWRVLQESDSAATPGPDRILEAREDALDLEDPQPDPAPPDAPADSADPADPRPETLGLSVSLPPGYLREAAAAAPADGKIARLLAADGLPVRLAVFARLLGQDDDVYPDAWRDPATGALPTMQQLAALAEVSLPTLRKRRDAAIARLGAAINDKRGSDA
ncbi:hypothetical protein [Massilia luteola]|uniref:hypothetical protein n=1 Tax=Massilia luteola TaxID=3081751 RepID=UPI002ACC1307|nr:hypothetical protein [Massilia sp. Gc5]